MLKKSMRKSILILFMCLMAFGIFAAATAAGARTVSAATDLDKKAKTLNGGKYQDKNGVYFVKKHKVLKSQWYNYYGERYYLKSTGYATRNCFSKIGGKYWLFDKYSHLVRPKKTSIVKVASNYCYVNKKGNPAGKGWITFGGKTYYVYASGYCARNKTINGIKLGADGVAQISALKVQARNAAKSFVNSHANGATSNMQKFRNAFNYILAYQNFYPNMDPPGYPSDKNWVYRGAIEMFENGLCGNCFGFASSIAACADACGLQPYVIATTGDHAFVMIDGLYYDNMGPLFGASTHFAYDVYQKIKY